ncbi:MAG: nitroreductase family protein [Acidimicrobiales bacterium]|nr:nitroreductase family protein [Acidimicrobiales bacterium]
MTDTIRARRMVRSFVPDAVGRDLVDGLCDLARRAPSAGNSQAVDLLVLEGPEQVDAYWDVTLPEERRRTFRWQGLLIAPVLILVAVSPDGYVERYAEDDKAETGLGVGTDSWPVPYWWVDAGAAIENLLLGVVDVGLGACLFGAFGHERAVAERFGVPSDRRLVATIAVGHPDTSTAVRGRSAGRPRRTLDEVIHRGTW